MIRIEAAALAFDSNGVPFSPRYQDIYHSADSGPGQALHVFLGGNGLPQRWQERETFTVLESGFGIGLNFLATCQQWREDPRRCGRLHYLAIEKHPFSSADLELLHEPYPQFAMLARELRAAWPLPLPGLHTMEFNGGRITLTLALGDAAVLLPSLRLKADAIYLDGFAPARNPEMWTPAIMKALAKLASPGTTLATYSSAVAVREGLQAAGFICEKQAGFGHKREMLCARFAPRWPLRTRATPARPPGVRHVLVIGAGLAGAAVSERLCARGWRVDLVEAQSAAAKAASALHAGVFHPHVSADDCILSRLSRHAFLQGLARWQTLANTGNTALKDCDTILEWDRCGVLQLPRDAGEERWMEDTLAAAACPPLYAQYLDRGKASAMAGAPVPRGGGWFPQGGWLRARSLVAAQLATCGSALQAHYGREVASLRHHDGQWQALDAAGALIAAAPLAVLANAANAQGLADFALPLRRVRGHLSLLDAARCSSPRAVITGTGYLLPAVAARIVTGSTYETPEDAPQSSADAQAQNLARLARLLPECFIAESTPGQIAGNQAGERAVARDRLPLIGAVPDLPSVRAQMTRLSGAQLADLPRLPGLYCATGFASRGIIWSALAGELLEYALEDAPLPIESELADAVDPARFALRLLRHGRL